MVEDNLCWQPDTERAKRTAMSTFRRYVSQLADVELPDSVALQDFSLADPERFWSALWDFAGVVGDKGERVFIDAPDMWAARFFPDARLNVVDTLLARRDDAPALLYAREDGLRRVISWAQLHTDVAAAARALRDAGVDEGDVVAAWLPNMPEAYVIALAAASIGATFTSTSPDFGAPGVLDRFGQVAPAVLIAADGYYYGGKAYDCMDRLRQIAAGLPSLRRLVVVPYLAEEPDLAGLPGVTTWAEFTARPSAEPRPRLSFDAPLFVLYSSGTTGAPKCIVHRAGGVLINLLKEHQLHCDVRPDDRVFYFTTTGWMMWNWLFGVLGSGAAAVVYDGSPTYPSPSALFDLVDELGITLFGTSARYLDSVRRLGLNPRLSHRLDTLRTITSTGSPLSPESFDYVYEAVKTDVHLASISGGTDICGCFVLGDPSRPVYRGEIQAPGLGMAVDVFDQAGSPAPVGATGELVCTRPFPSMPLGFWADDEGQRYRAAYFTDYPGVWRHGDWAARTENGGFVISGRSDATLNPGGVRIGTAEIYRQLEALPQISEAVAIGQDVGGSVGDVRVVLFVTMADGEELTDQLRDRIKQLIRTNCSPRHVPALILAVPDIPRTRSGKLVELAVGDVVAGRPVRNTESLANPESLEHFRGLAQPT